MLDTIPNSTRYIKPKLYDDQWIDYQHNQISWLNCMTIQTIPEEPDIIECSRRCHTDSDCSSSSSDDFYVVLEVQRPRSTEPTIDIIDQQLTFAQINHDEHHIEYDQLAHAFSIEEPAVEHAVEKIATSELSYHIHSFLPIILDQPYSKYSSDSQNKAQRQRNNEIIVLDALSNLSTIFEETTTTDRNSTVSIDSIDNFSSRFVSGQIERLPTLNRVPSPCKFEPINLNEENPAVIKPMPKRRYVLEKPSMEKQHRFTKRNINQTDLNNKYGMGSPFYLHPKPQVLNYRSSTPNTLTHTSSEAYPPKKRRWIIKSAWNISDDSVKKSEPSLIQVKYLDGRPTLTNSNTRESLEKSKHLSCSMSSQSNLLYVQQKEDTPTHTSIRKRILNRFQNLFKSPSTPKPKSWQQKTILELFNAKKK